MGLLITTDDKPVMVFREDKEYKGETFASYKIGVSSKSKDGKDWIKSYVPCRFKKGVELENMTKISIANAFYGVSEGKEYNYYYIVITDFKIVQEETKDDFMDIPDGIPEELPFK